MTADELAAWSEANERLRNPVKSACLDCPMAFALEMRAAGCCNGEPGVIGRPRIDQPRVAYTGRRGPFKRYATAEDRVMARRQQWREYQSRRRAALA